MRKYYSDNGKRNFRNDRSYSLCGRLFPTSQCRRIELMGGKKLFFNYIWQTSKHVKLKMLQGLTMTFCSPEQLIDFFSKYSYVNFLCLVRQSNFPYVFRSQTSSFRNFSSRHRGNIEKMDGKYIIQVFPRLEYLSWIFPGLSLCFQWKLKKTKSGD